MRTIQVSVLSSPCDVEYLAANLNNFLYILYQLSLASIDQSVILTILSMLKKVIFLIQLLH